ncbi:hypothetical protein HKCCE4037_06150 [Rhodobacterales bacterium HKCCE4037]|nr:hypothetical protein [Rhodobacterales bacterium HKCCE4037]
MAAAFAAAGYAVDSVVSERHVAAEELAMTRASASFAAILERKLDERVHLTEAIRSVFEAAPDLSAEEYEEMAQRLSSGLTDVVNIAAAPDLVIEYVHPVAPNQAALGINLAELPRFESAITSAIATGEVVIDGPVEIVQGGLALITRAAVEEIGTSDEESGLWGVVSVVVDIDELLLTALNDFESGGLEVRVTSSDGAVVFGSDALTTADPVTTDVNGAGLNWEVSVAPIGGWSPGTPYRVEIWGATILLCLASLIVMRWLSAVSHRTVQAEIQLQEAIEALEDAFALYDQDDRLIMCNTNYLRTYAASSEAIVPGATFEEILRYGLAKGQYFDAIGREEEWLEQRLDAHYRSGLTLEQPLVDGRWVRVVERKTASGNTVGFRVDITQLKQALEKSEAASRAKSTFLNTISHELRTPLTVVLGYNAFVREPRKLPSYKALSDMVRADGSAETRAALTAFEADLTRFGRQIDVSGQQLLSLISTILDLAAVEEGSITLSLERIDLATVASDVTEQFQLQASEKGIALVNEAKTAFAEVDPLRIRQIMFNLVGNALKFTKEGTVTIRSGVEDGSPWIEVADTGCGIAAEDQDTIFDDFTQVGSIHGSGNTGVGLGLSISRQLARLHHGELTVESTEGEGSVFRLRFSSEPSRSNVAA